MALVLLNLNLFRTFAHFLFFLAVPRSERLVQAALNVSARLSARVIREEEVTSNFPIYF
jgi:hypothetical protein